MPARSRKPRSQLEAEVTHLVHDSRYQRRRTVAAGAPSTSSSETPAAPQHPRRRLLGEVSGARIYLVSGEQVRDELDVDFTQGGNDAVYDYVPAGEVWVDDAAHALDRTATALHELVERDLMQHHGMDYDRAHDAASARERTLRRALVLRRPARFDLRSVADAYEAYLADAPRPRRARRGSRAAATAGDGRSRPRPHLGAAPEVRPPAGRRATAVVSPVSQPRRPRRTT